MPKNGGRGEEGGAGASRGHHWRQRLAGVKRAVAHLLVRAPRLRVAHERLLRAQLAQGLRGGELLRREVQLSALA